MSVTSGIVGVMKCRKGFELDIILIFFLGIITTLLFGILFALQSIERGNGYERATLREILKEIKNYKS